jgi:hypothetical protein
VLAETARLIPAGKPSHRTCHHPSEHGLCGSHALASIQARGRQPDLSRRMSNSRGGCPVTRLNTREKAAALS